MTGSHGHKITASPEDVKITINEDDLATQIIESIDKSFDGIFEALHESTSATDSSEISNENNIEITEDAGFVGMRILLMVLLYSIFRGRKLRAGYLSLNKIGKYGNQ